MLDFIRDIPSDSTIKNIVIKKEFVQIDFLLDIYEGDKDTKAIVFEEMEAFHLHPGWDDKVAIDGIAIKDDSELLKEVKNLLTEENGSHESINSLKSFQILNSWGGDKVVIEIIARAYKIQEVGSN